MGKLARKRDVKWRQVGDEVVIYNKLSQNVHILNQTAMDIFMLCNGNNEIETITDALQTRYDVPREELSADIIEIIDTFEKLQLLEKNE